MRLLTPTTKPADVASRRPQLGDMLQRLALISPHDLYAISLIVGDTLKRAEAEHATNRRRGVRY